MKTTLVIVAALALSACGLIEPRNNAAPHIGEPVPPQLEQVAPSADARVVRIARVDAREHLRHAVLTRSQDGELIPDPVWRWSTTPDRYLAEFLPLIASSLSEVRVEETIEATELRITLTAFDLVPGDQPQVNAAALVTTISPAGSSETHRVSVSLPAPEAKPRAVSETMSQVLVELCRQILSP
ncbi:MAG: ABC-type transport auxiliary lipoprotein family protein [Planctomycetota bacterium]|jgi:uncharacterized lipoprotein YmbA|nr:ABC-type transport auxiliary lipoprotein family protein [Planctomycetota bacterium]